MIEKLRWKMFVFAWRLNFTGRMIEKTHCTIKTGWNRSKKAQDNSPFWHDAKPGEYADHMIETGEL
jgi:hypothetical protein